MTDFILIHGAWRGSWTWTRVRRLLAAAGHQVFTPTLTGPARPRLPFLTPGTDIRPDASTSKRFPSRG
jgi:hypothetical protein